jgi:hypothetical protein
LGNVSGVPGDTISGEGDLDNGLIQTKYNLFNQLYKKFLHRIFPIPAPVSASFNRLIYIQRLFLSKSMLE